MSQPSKIVNLKVRLPDSTTRELTVERSVGSPSWLAFRDFDGTLRKFEAVDLFEALIAMRQELEGRGCRLLCAGARIDVWPSGMSRSMGQARKAFIVRPGKPAGMESMVDIFDYAEPELVGTIEQQRAHFQEWRDSWIKRP
jgi:hypothetical protein